MMSEASSDALQPSIAIETSVPTEPHATETKANTSTGTGASQVCAKLDPLGDPQVLIPNPSLTKSNQTRNQMKKDVLTI